MMAGTYLKCSLPLYASENCREIVLHRATNSAEIRQFGALHLLVARVSAELIDELDQGD